MDYFVVYFRVHIYHAFFRIAIVDSYGAWNAGVSVRKKHMPLRFLLTVALATLFHISAFILLALYPPYYAKLQKMVARCDSCL